MGNLLLGTFFAIVCVLLIVIVLLQKGRGGGLGAAFGGAGSSAFGTRVGDVLTLVNVALVALFLILAVVVVYAFRPPGGQVATPTFNPPNNSTNEEIVVTISCDTLGAEFYYTLDGSDPDETSRQYISSLTVEPGTTLKAKAFRAGMDPSNTREGYYGVSAAAPETPPGALETNLPETESETIEQPSDAIDTTLDANTTPAVPLVDANVVAE